MPLLYNFSIEDSSATPEYNRETSLKVNNWVPIQCSTCSHLRFINSLGCLLSNDIICLDIDRNENESVVLYPSIHAGIVPGHLEGGVQEAVQDLHGTLINDAYSYFVDDQLN